MKRSTSRNWILIAARTLLKRTTCEYVEMIFSPRSTSPRWLFAISNTNRSSKMSLFISSPEDQSSGYLFDANSSCDKNGYMSSSAGVTMVPSSSCLDRIRSRQLEDGTIDTPALDDMYPFLSQEELASNRYPED